MREDRYSTKKVTEEIIKLSNKERSVNFEKFFQTTPGQYGAGDKFLGVRVPEIREIAKKYSQLSTKHITMLAKSEYHEIRLCALIILANKFKEDIESRATLFNIYLNLLYKGRVNNWDLVDSTAPIFGQYLVEHDNAYQLLNTLASNPSLWQRRVSILLTFAFIKEGYLEPTIIVAEKLLDDEEDLIHKATGWALREVGKIDLAVLRKFLKNNSEKMPRTMLRYSIEKLPEDERVKWLTESRALRSK